MISIDLTGKTVLITGGTKGIGLAAGLEFGRAGAKVYLTSKWMSADPEDVRRQFAAAGALPPVILEADASMDEDTEKLLAEIRKHETKIDVFISNVGFAQKVKSLAEYKKKSLFKSLEYSSWPIIDYTRKIAAVFGNVPRYVLGVSSDGPDHFYPGYDFVAASKAMLELFARYLSAHVFDDDCRVNVVRFGPVKTESFGAFFDAGFFDHLRKENIPEHRMLTVEDCGKTLLAMCSGLFDAMHGQVITVNHGLTFIDNSLMQFTAKRAKNKDGATDAARETT